MALSLRRYEENRPLDIWRNDRRMAEFESGLGHFFGDLFDDCMVCKTPQMTGVLSPEIDVKETHDALEVSAEIPGISQEDIDVSLHDGVLTISGEKKVENQGEDVDYRFSERAYGCFSRDIPLPDGVNMDDIHAAYKNGVLIVTLPKTEQAMKEFRKIPVTTA